MFWPNLAIYMAIFGIFTQESYVDILKVTQPKIASMLRKVSRGSNILLGHQMR